MKPSINTYYTYREVPLDLAIPSVWRMRGYKVIETSKPVARLKQQFGGVKEDLPLYGLGQVKQIMGEKARHRRRVFIAALYGEE